MTIIDTEFVCISILFMLSEKQANKKQIDVFTPESIKICFICLIESPLKMQNTFYFMLKSSFLFKIFNFCRDFLAMYKKRFD